MSGGYSNALRWGIMGVGGISNDFSVGLIANGSKIAAVAARDAERAESFRARFNADRAHGSYEALANDAEVDVVYIGTIHTMHLPHARLAMEQGKHVVCEKPLAINETEVQELVTLARSKGVFFMEALWTRFFPAIRKAREIIKSGVIGTPKCVQCDFGFVGPTDENHRLLDPKQAGGAMLDIGVYCVQAATMAFGASLPDQIACTAQKATTGVDNEGTLALTWKGKGSASLMFTILANTPEITTIICSDGYLRIDGPAHCPTELTKYKSLERGVFEEEKFSFPLPECPSGHKVNYPRSEGMIYQVQAVEECIKAGHKECPEYTLDESIVVTQIMDAYRKQVGVVYPSEQKAA